MNDDPIIILHGWNLSSLHYLPLIRELNSRSHEVLCPDLPGFGINKILKKSLTLTDYADFVEVYLKEKKIKQAVIIGHSFGGRIALRLAATSPESIQKLILSGVPGFSPVATIKTEFYKFIAKSGKNLLKITGLSRYENYFRFNLYKSIPSSDYTKTAQELKETFKKIINESLLADMTQIKIPVLLIWGREDRIVPVKIAEKMKNLISGSELDIVPDARHSLPYSHPREFADKIDNFIN